MLNEEELKKAFYRHLPVMVEVSTTASNGIYPYNYISAMVIRYDSKLDKMVSQIEVRNTRNNSVMITTADNIRFATPNEIIDFGIGDDDNECFA